MIINRKGIVADTDKLTWRKSSFSNASGCVEIAKVEGGRLLRDSKNPQDGVLAFDSHEWVSFLQAAKYGQFDE